MLKIRKDLKKILCAVFISMFLMAFLHELGHCIAVWFYGGRVTEFQFILLWNAHMNYEGDGIGWQPLIHLAGPLFPVLIAFCLLFTYRRDSRRTFVYYLKTIYIFESISSLGSWIFMPILFLSGVWDPSEDVNKFLLISEISPVVVVLTATAAILLMAFIFIKKITAASSSEWQKKNIRRMGIWLIGVLMIVIFISPLVIRLDALSEMGGSFRITEKESSPDSPLKKQYEIEIEDSGTYGLNMYWGGECSGVITAVTLNLGDETVFYCTAEKIYMESDLLDLENGTYTFSIYCLNSMEEFEAFYAMLGEEVPEMDDYNFQGVGRYVVYGNYEVVKKR